METNEVLENVEIAETINDAVTSATGRNVNPMVVGGVAAAGVAAIGFGKFVLWDKVVKPGAAKAKVKLADAKAKRAVRKNEEHDDLKISNGKLVVDKDSEEQE